MKRRLPRGLYVITDASIGEPDVLARQAAAGIAGGAVTFQYRDKSDDPDRRRRAADRLVRLCRASGVVLLVNDDPELALACGADGVHLGRDDTPYEQARHRLGPDALIGMSCYDSLERAHAAAAAGADYVALGSAYPSPTKPGAVHAPLALYVQACRELPIPVVAIGGITPLNAEPLIAAGCHAVAVISAISGAADVAATARQLQSLFGNGARPPGLE
jgi:thiamine-phosphate pyrophosphorylase